MRFYLKEIDTGWIARDPYTTIDPFNGVGGGDGGSSNLGDGGTGCIGDGGSNG